MPRDKKLIVSPLSGAFSRDGIAVDVYIYRLETDDRWTLEVADKNNTSKVWDDKFATDRAAHDFLLESVEAQGLAQVIADDSPTWH